MFNFSDHVQELRSAVIGLILLLATIIIGVVWISIGIAQCLTLYLGAVWGPIVMGFICFVPVLIFALVKTFGHDNSRAELMDVHREHADAAVSNIATIFESLSGRSPLFVAIAAIVAGFLVNRYPAILTMFTQILSAYAEDVKARAAKEAATASECSHGNDTNKN